MGHPPLLQVFIVVMVSGFNQASLAGKVLVFNLYLLYSFISSQAMSYSPSMMGTKILTLQGAIIMLVALWAIAII